MNDIEGWMDEEELDYLKDQGEKFSFILEIGVWKGRSTQALAQGRNLVIAIDSFNGTGNTTLDNTYYPDRVNSEREARENLKDYPNVNIIRANSNNPVLINALHELFQGKIGFIFIDGDHSEEQVFNDIKNYITLLNPEYGVIAGHDLGKPQSVTNAVNSFFGGNYHIPAGTIWEVKL